MLGQRLLEHDAVHACVGAITREMLADVGCAGRCGQSFDFGRNAKPLTRSFEGANVRETRSVISDEENCEPRMNLMLSKRDDPRAQCVAEFRCNGSAVEYSSGHAVRLCADGGRTLDSARVRAALPWIAAGIVIVASAVVLVPLFKEQTQRQGGPAGMAGRTAPVLELQTDRGAEVSLRQYRGRVVLVNLWASWCPPCREEMPDLQRLYAADAARGLVVIGIDQGESPQRARDFARALGVRYPIWIDNAQAYGRAFSALGLPTSVVLDSHGTIVAGFDGALTFSQMQQAVSALLVRRRV
jgi:thiol-disulfide isomerase/thioredoxin